MGPRKWGVFISTGALLGEPEGGEVPFLGAPKVTKGRLWRWTWAQLGNL